MLWWQVLIRIHHRYMRGLALQTYTTPGQTKVLKRLYVAAARKGSHWSNPADTEIVRLNLDHLETIAANGPAPHGKWGDLTKVVVPAAPSEFKFSRLSYASGKIYYMSADLEQRYVLTSTDVTVAVSCKDVMSLLEPEFKKWPIGKHGKAYEVRQGLRHSLTPHAPRVMRELK